MRSVAVEKKTGRKFIEIPLVFVLDLKLITYFTEINWKFVLKRNKICILQF